MPTGNKEIAQNNEEAGCMCINKHCVGWLEKGVGTLENVIKPVSIPTHYFHAGM